MNLLDRYIHEVGRHLPRKNRSDIQAELRSSFVDTLEDRFGQDASEEQTSELLKEFGQPRDVAASYHPQSQYLIGPTLYPIFRMVIWIVIAAVLGAQILAWGIGIFVDGDAFSVWEMLASLVASVPASLGWVVITFMILQYFDAKPDLENEPWDPTMLPEINPGQDTKRGELIVSLVFSTLILALVTLFPQWVGFITFPGGNFYPNPVILDYLTLIQVSLLATILMNIYLLWKGSWTFLTRVIKLGLDAFGVVILAFLIQGHNAWLAAKGSSSFTTWISSIGSNNWELVGMHAFRLAFVVAFIVTIIEIFATIFRMVRSKMASDVSAKDFVLKVE
ncbi:MAG: hypothetical protein DRI65_09005 [Chloroflexota bacterium]|nr:MAG: hypothetical protein DRI65_09005 [Chloroflexota bacterium]HDD61673.1 hypothetical protein [Chloroflexota bacterium]